MATRSAAKAHRQSLKRRLRNRAVKSATKSAVKRANESIAAGDPEVSREAVRGAIQALDRAAKKGVIHPNNAARRKSRLFLKFNAAVAALQVTADAGAPQPKPKAKTRAAPKKAAAPKAAAKPKTKAVAKATTAKEPKKAKAKK